jgi:hypothetical protein
MGNTVYLDRGFSIRRGEKFRNQQVQVTVEVPVGRRVVVDKKVSRRLNKWFMIGNRNRHWRDWEWNDDEEFTWLHGDWNKDVEYIMTPAGIKRVEDLDQDELKKGNYRDRDYDAEREAEQRPKEAGDEKTTPSNNRKPYRYQGDTATKKIVDTVRVNTPSTTTYKETTEVQEEESSYSHEKSSSVFRMSSYVFGRLIQQ